MMPKPGVSCTVCSFPSIHHATLNLHLFRSSYYLCQTFVQEIFCCNDGRISDNQMINAQNPTRALSSGLEHCDMRLKYSYLHSAFSSCFLIRNMSRNKYWNLLVGRCVFLLVLVLVLKLILCWYTNYLLRVFLRHESFLKDCYKTSILLLQCTDNCVIVMLSLVETFFIMLWRDTRIRIWHWNGHIPSQSIRLVCIALAWVKKPNFTKQCFWLMWGLGY